MVTTCVISSQPCNCGYFLKESRGGNKHHTCFIGLLRQQFLAVANKLASFKLLTYPYQNQPYQAPSTLQPSLHTALPPACPRAPHLGFSRQFRTSNWHKMNSGQHLHPSASCPRVRCCAPRNSEFNRQWLLRQRLLIRRKDRCQKGISCKIWGLAGKTPRAIPSKRPNSPRVP